MRSLTGNPTDVHLHTGMTLRLTGLSVGTRQPALPRRAGPGLPTRTLGTRSPPDDPFLLASSVDASGPFEPFRNIYR